MNNNKDIPDYSKRRLLAVGAAIGAAAPLLMTSGGSQAASSSVAGVLAVEGLPGSDLSNAIQAAVITLAMSGGGTVDLPSGTYFVQGVVVSENVYIRGQGRHATILCLPDNATTHMFSLDTPSDRVIINGPGFYSMTLLGKLSPHDAKDYSVFNAIDASSAVAVYDYFVQDCTFQYFNIAYNGASYNRHPSVNNQYYSKIWNCRFEYNNLAVYADEEIEISYTTMNNNNVAYKGRPNDGKISHCEFEYNNIAMMPLDEDESSIRNFLISNCIFFKNKIFDMKLGDNSMVSACSFVGEPDAITFGVGIVGNNIRIADCKFNEANGQYMDSCINIIGRPTVSYVQDLSINSCSYISHDLAQAGAFVKVALRDAASDLARISIVGCNWLAQASQFFVSALPNSVNDYYFSENQIYVSGGNFDSLVGGSLIYIASSIVGGSVVNNRFIANVNTTCLAGNLGQLMIFGNVFRANSVSVCQVFSSTASFVGQSILKDNIGLRTKNQGVAVVTNSNYVVVYHQLDLGLPSASDISLVALSNLMGVNMWVASVSSSIFVINFSSPVSVQIAWSIKVYQ